MHRHLSPVWLCVLTLFLALSALRPAAPAGDASDLLTETIINHEKVVTAALAPIDAEYKAALEKTLQSAKENNNVDLLARAQQEIDKLSVKPLSLEGAGPKAAYVGFWNCLYLANGNAEELELLADGVWQNRRWRQGGRWTYGDQEIVIHFDYNNDWHDHYDLPGKDGVLPGHNAEGNLMQLTRRGAPVSEEFKAMLVGTWKYYDAKRDLKSDVAINADGSYFANGQRIGFWQVGGGNRLYVNYDGHSDWHSIYALPPADGVLQGRNQEGNILTLTRAADAK